MKPRRRTRRGQGQAMTSPRKIISQAIELEARYGEDLEPRAVSASVTHGIIIPFFLAYCVVGLALAVSGWAMRGFEVIAR